MLYLVGFWGTSCLGDSISSNPEKWNASCHISKQMMSQSSVIVALQREWVIPEETQKDKNICHLAAIR